jgi:hypothetical protein
VALSLFRFVSELLYREERGGDTLLRITNAGFQFLLRNIYSQLWSLLLAFIETAEVCSLCLSPSLSLSY